MSWFNSDEKINEVEVKKKLGVSEMTKKEKKTTDMLWWDNDVKGAREQELMVW